MALLAALETRPLAWPAYQACLPAKPPPRPSAPARPPAASAPRAEVLRNATSPTSPKLSFRLWIPAVDPDTGLFAAFGVVQRAGREPGVFRILGMGAATEDGVLLVVRPAA